MAHNILAIFLIFSWIFSGYPQLFDFPSSVPRAYAESPPSAPTLYSDDGGATQIAFNNIHQNTTQPNFRASATHEGGFDRFQLELNTALDFSGSAYTQTFSGTFASGTPYNLTADNLSSSFSPNNNDTFYVRVRASADGGVAWGDWSTDNHPIWTFTYKSADEPPDWFQQTEAQFETGILDGVEAAGEEGIQLITNEGVYFTDFEEQALDIFPSGWTERWNTSNSTWSIKEDNGIHILQNVSDAGRRFLSLDEIDSDPNRADVELVTRLRMHTDSWEHTGLGLRGSGSASNETGYVVWFENRSDVVLRKFVNGSLSTIAEDNFSWSANNWYWLRFRAEGSQLKVRVWADGAPEPDSWQIDTNDESIPSAGWVGMSSFIGATRDWDFIGIATSGGTAPIANTIGTITSTAIKIDWLPDMSWSEVTAEGNTTNGSIELQVLGADEEPLEGYICTVSGGGCTIDVSTLDPINNVNHEIIYLKAVLEDDGGSPILESWSVSWAEAIVPPSVTTGAASKIATSSATLIAELTELGGKDVIEHGFAYGVVPDLDITIATTTLGATSTTGTFSETVSDLGSNTMFYFRAYAANPVGTSTGEILSFLTLPGPPEIPTFSSVATSTLTVEWESHTLGADDYTLQRCEGEGCTGEDFALVASGITELSHDDDNLTPNTIYRYRVRGTNDTGEGDWSDIGTIPTKDFPTVATFAADPIGHASATLNADLTSAGGHIGEGTDHGFAWGTDPTLTNGGTATTSLGTYGATGTFDQTVSDLSPNTDYHFRAWAANSIGTTTGSILSFLTLPAAPGTPNATDVSTSTLTVLWTAPPGEADSYKLERCTGAECEEFLQILDANVLFYEDLERSPNTLYRYRVQAANSTGDGKYSGILDTLTLPGVPGTPTFTNVQSNALTVNWEAPDSGAETYKVERCAGAECDDFEEAAAGIEALSFTDTDLFASTLYRYRVRANNMTGVGAFSAIAEQMTPSAASFGGGADIGGPGPSGSVVGGGDGAGGEDIGDEPGFRAPTASAGVEAGSGGFPMRDGSDGIAPEELVSSVEVPLPAGGHDDKQLLLVGTLSWPITRSVDTPSGWTQLYHVAGDIGDVRAFAFTRDDLTGSGGTVTLTASDGAGEWSVHSIRYANAASIEATTAAGHSTNPNPPILEPSWGAADTLWEAVAHDASFNATTPTSPDNYSNQLVEMAGASRTTVAERQLNAVSEDPGTFTLGDSGDWVASTIAIEPVDGVVAGWANPDNAIVSNGSYATANTFAATDYHDFDFNVPEGNEITGIAVKILASANSAGGTVGAELSWNGGAATTTTGKTTDALTTSGVVYDLGGSSDLWGRGDPWAPSDFSDANFRLRIIANPDANTLQLDALQVRVYHQSTGGGSGGGGDI